MHTARIWMALAIPGGAPGYDDGKQFGNYITHMTARTSQRLREPYRPNLKSQGKATLGAIFRAYRGCGRSASVFRRHSPTCHCTSKDAPFKSAITDLRGADPEFRDSGFALRAPS